MNIVIIREIILLRWVLRMLLIIVFS